MFNIMSNFFGQLPSQYNNRYAGNNIINEYQQYRNTNVPFTNNTMFANNPMCYGSIRDPHFYERINMAKMEQTKKIKNISELNLSTDQLINYVICPIKVERMDKKEYDQIYADRESTYITTAKGKTPKILQDWWKNRQNTPYKNILKNENYSKNFKKAEDLIVHKITQLDKDKIRLKTEYEALTRLLERHNGELKVVFSASKETEHAEKFNYINKYKNRIKYDPKNYNELKEIYKKTQKKIKKDNRRIDEMIELMLVSDQLTKEDKKEIEKSLEVYASDNTEDVDMEKIFRDGERKITKQLEKDLKKEIGSEVFDELMRELDNGDEKGKSKTKEKVKEKVKENNERAKPKIKVKKIEGDTIVKSNPVQKLEIGQVDNEELEKYKNRSK